MNDEATLMLTFLIMAGGSGERFWPLSTKENPKQLLKIFADKSLIRLTYENILPLAAKERIFVATNKIQAEVIKQELPELNDSQIIIEPEFRDTASAIAYGSMMISKYYQNPTICVLASDHLIKDVDEFRKAIRIAEKQAEEDNIITLGIKPTYPETGYGYIKIDNDTINVPTKSLGFVEKPNLELAKTYLDSHKYLWNSGMFIFKYSTIIDAFKKHSPNHYQTINKIDNLVDKNKGTVTAEKVKDIFKEFEKKSIDFAVMEKADNIIVIPSDFGWNDVGSYLAFESLFEKNEDNNILLNINCICVDSHNNIVISDGDYQKVSLLGVNNMIVVVTKDNILVCPKERNQDIKKIING